MTYIVHGLAPAPFAPLFALDDDALVQQSARRVFADSDRGFPCRVSLDDAKAGEELILVNHVSHDVANPYRAAHAIYVRRNAGEAALYVDETPPVFAGRPLSLRGFDAEGMLAGALLAPPGEADAAIRALFARSEIVTIHAHNAAYGCFAARIERN
jgi:hypothetical protein